MDMVNIANSNPPTLLRQICNFKKEVVERLHEFPCFALCFETVACTKYNEIVIIN